MSRKMDGIEELFMSHILNVDRVGIFGGSLREKISFCKTRILNSVMLLFMPRILDRIGKI